MDAHAARVKLQLGGQLVGAGGASQAGQACEQPRARRLGQHVTRGLLGGHEGKLVTVGGADAVVFFLV
jgi:hypothetical protein